MTEQDTNKRIITISLHHDNSYTYQAPEGATGRDPRYTTTADVIAAAQYVYGENIETRMVLAA